MNKIKKPSTIFGVIRKIFVRCCNLQGKYYCKCILSCILKTATWPLIICYTLLGDLGLSKFMFRKYGKLCKSHFFIQTKVLIKYITLEFVAAHVQSKWADWLRVDKDIPHPLQLQRQLNSFRQSKMSAATAHR